MTQVLVSSLPMPLVSPPPEEVGRSLPQQQLQLSASPVCMEEKRMASQLAYLASQHHASEYNRLKFGPSGAPIMYIPLSIQLPDHVRELQARQVQHSQQRLWWPAKTPRESPSDFMGVDPLRNHISKYLADSIQVQQENVVPSLIPVHTTGPEHQSPAAHHGKPCPTLNHLPTLNLQRELSVAMSSPLSIITIPQLSPRVAFQQPNLNSYAKTSESHPINISPIVPFELLPLITSHLACAPQHSSQMFDLPPSLLLHHLIAHSSSSSTELVRSHPLMRVTNSSLPFPMNGVTPPAPNQFPLGAYGMHEPVFITTGSSPAAQDGNVRHSSNWLQRYGEPDVTQPSESLAPGPGQTSTLISPPISALSPPSLQDRCHSAPPSLLPSSLILPESTSKVITSPPPLPEVVCAMSSDILAGIDNAKAIERAAVSHPVVRDISSPWAMDAAPSFVPSLRPALGNMLLSSCPGKKVRLTGPVKGRGAICRDLGHDLRRVKALGVGCIICCLDDEELEFLGASWPQYSEIAQAVGLDVLRVPIPEGLSPPSPSLFDQHLSYIIHFYTLQGIPVLVHCRGGVGRAGLVACCWMLKLGLCGRIDPTVDDYIAYPVTERGDAVAKVRRGTLELVERAIGVVRRRRSVKAIETYEQVRFLVEFVEHLKAASSTPRS
ncbi:hypothetical protein JB92DRAFT_2969022 [Gautieria morchelliformis]|nr:hypothetical protein JB92DRAFT_2969022 [Gautieria morchelliformis]